MTATLVRYEAARTALAEAHRVDEAKEIRDKALALAAYAKQAQDRDMIGWATEIKIRAERRTGELLKQTAESGQRHPKGRPAKNTADERHLPTLRELKISPEQRDDWQRLAAIPEREFERRIQAASGDPAAMTTAKILKPPAKPMVKDPFEDQHRVWAGVSGWLSRVESLPELDELKGTRPTGGVKAALRKNFLAAETYMAGLRRLHKEDWI